MISKDKKKLQQPQTAKFSSYWSADHHKIISNPQKKAEPYCAMWGTSITGMCPHCDAQQKSQPRCREWCDACKVPLHLACAFEYHARFKDFDREKWFVHNFLGVLGLPPVPMTPEHTVVHVSPGECCHNPTARKKVNVIKNVINFHCSNSFGEKVDFRRNSSS